MNGLEIVRGLIDRGYAPHQAAALAGHMLQESGGNPSALNKDEGAFGLTQWRLDRRTNLENFAKAQGKEASDPNVQLDFVGKELSGPEKKAGAAFLAAPDVASASAALKPYIRFGDDSAGARLNNATGLFSQFTGNAPVGALARSPVDPTSPADPTQTSSAPVSLAPPAQVGALTPGSSLSSLASTLSGGSAQPQMKAPEYLPQQQIAMAQPNTGQSAQIVAALAKMYGIA